MDVAELMSAAGYCGGGRTAYRVTPVALCSVPVRNLDEEADWLVLVAGDHDFESGVSIFQGLDVVVETGIVEGVGRGIRLSGWGNVVIAWIPTGLEQFPSFG